MKTNEKIKVVADKLITKYGSKSIDSVTNADVLIQPEATSGGGKGGVQGETYTPKNKTEKENDDDKIIIDDDDNPEDGGDGDGEGGDGEDDGEGKAKGKGKGKGKEKGKDGGDGGDGGDDDGGDDDGGDDDGGDDDGGDDDGGDDDGGDGDGGGSGSDDVKCQYKVGDIVTIKRTGAKSVITSVEKKDGTCVYQLAALTQSELSQKMANGGLVTPPQPQPQGYNEDEIELAQPAIDYDALLARMDEMEAYRVKSYRYMYQLYLAESKRLGEIEEYQKCRKFFRLCGHALEGFAIQQFLLEIDKNQTSRRSPWQYYDSYPSWFFWFYQDTFDYPNFNIKRFPFVPKSETPSRYYDYAELRALATNPNADQIEKDLAFAMLSESLADFEAFKTQDYEIYKSVSLLSVSKPELFSEETAYFNRFDYVLQRLGRKNIAGYSLDIGYAVSMHSYSRDEDKDDFANKIQEWTNDGFDVYSITIRKISDAYLYEIIKNANNSDKTQNIYTGVVKYHSESRDVTPDYTAWTFLKHVTISLTWLAFGTRSKQDRERINKLINSFEDAQIRKVKEVIFNLQLKTINYK